MILHKRYRKLILALITLFFAGLACNIPWLNTRIPNELKTVPIPTQVVIPETQSDPNTENIVPDVNERFSFQISEFELTSMLNDEMSKREDIGINDPRVYLRDGIVELNGQYMRSGLNLPLAIKLTLFIDNNNQLQYKIASAKIGPFPLPGYVLDQLTSYLDQAISDNLKIQKETIIFEQVIVDNGLLMINGYYR